MLHSGDFRLLRVTGLGPVRHRSYYLSMRYERKREDAAEAILRATAACELTLECSQAIADSGGCARPSTLLMRRQRGESAGICDVRGEQVSMVSGLSLTVDFERVWYCAVLAQGGFGRPEMTVYIISKGG